MIKSNQNFFGLVRAAPMEQATWQYSTPEHCQGWTWFKKTSVVSSKQAEIKNVTPGMSSQEDKVLVDPGSDKAAATKRFSSTMPSLASTQWKHQLLPSLAAR